MNTETMKIQMLPPEALLANRNIRFGLKKVRVMAMADSIKALGRVEVPLKVVKLDEQGPNGETHVVSEGNYRHAGALEVNKEGGGIKVPVEVVEHSSDVERIEHQVRENIDREDMSAMDVAIALQALRDAGKPDIEIRALFARPGGRKGNTMAPMSTTTFFFYLRYLKFPKKIQNMIHEGVLPVSEANKLCVQPEEKWNTIIEAAEADRLKEIEQEAKLEEKFLADQRKAEEQEAKAKAEKEALEKSQQEVTVLSESAKAKRDEAAAAYQAVSKAKAKDEKKAAEEEFRKKDAEAKVEERKAEDARKLAEKLQTKADEAAKLAAERREKLEAARKEAQKEAEAKSSKKLDVGKAAAKASGNGYVPLTATDMRRVVADLSLAGSYPKVQKIFQSVGRCFSGEITDQQLTAEVAYLTGERKEKPKTLKA